MNATPTGTARRGRPMVTAAVTAVALGATIGALWAGLGPAPVEPVSEVRLEATSFAGPNPFMTPVGTDRAGLVAPANTAGTFTGDTPGLFGEETDKPSCTTQALIDNLAADSTKSGAWAQALGIAPVEIADYVGSLNPVVLRSDTAVTEHGYAEGTYTAYPAVLQAGTAALVNSFGEPTVKCFSGNPLTRPGNFVQASYVGPTWRSFAPTRITYVRPTKVVVAQYVYIDIDRGESRSHRSWCGEHSDSKYCERPNPDRWCETHPDSKHCSDGRQDEHEGKPDDEGKHDDKPDDEDKHEGKPGGPGTNGDVVTDGGLCQRTPEACQVQKKDADTVPGGGTKEPDGSITTPPSGPCPGGPGCLAGPAETKQVGSAGPAAGKSEGGPAGAGPAEGGLAESGQAEGGQVEGGQAEGGQAEGGDGGEGE